MEPTPRRERSGSRKLLRYAPFVGILLAIVLIWLLFGRSDDTGNSANPKRSGGGRGPVVFSDSNKDSVKWGPNCDTSRGTVAVPLTYAPPCVEPFQGNNGGAT